MNKYLAAIVSIVTRKPVFTGIGVSVDSNTKVSDKTYRGLKESYHNEGVVKHFTYVARDKESIGEFRLINLSRKIPGKVHYQLKHMPSGKVFNLPKDLLELLFERK